MKLARDTIYDSPTRTLMKGLLVQMLKHPIEFEEVDAKTFAVRLDGYDQLEGCRIWTEDFNSWKVRSLTIMRLKRQKNQFNRS